MYSLNMTISCPVERSVVEIRISTFFHLRSLPVCDRSLENVLEGTIDIRAGDDRYIE